MLGRWLGVHCHPGRLPWMSPVARVGPSLSGGRCRQHLPAEYARDQTFGIGQKRTSPPPMLTESNLLIVLVALIATVIFGLDRYNHWRAKQVRTLWNCFRCGVQLGPMESTFTKVAGSEAGTQARVCQRCAKRESLKVWIGVGAMAVAFTLALFFTLA